MSRALTLAVLLLVALAFAGVTGASDPNAAIVTHGLLMVAAVVALVWAPRRDEQQRVDAGVAITLAAFGALIFIGIAFAPYRFAAWLSAVEFAFFCLAVGLAAGARPALDRLLLGWLALASLGQVGMIVWQRFSVGMPRPSGGFENPNDVAAFLIAAALYIAADVAVRSERRWLLAIAAVAVAGAMLTGSRGALIGLVAGALLLGASLFSSWSSRTRKIALGGFALALVLAGVGVGLRYREPDPYRFQRLKIWRAALQLPLEQPLTGAGPGQFSRAALQHQFPDGRSLLRYDRSFRTTHSDWLRAPAELGWPGAAALIAIVAASCAAWRRRLRDTTRGALPYAAVIAALFAHAAVDNLTRAPALTLLAGCALGGLAATAGPLRRRWPLPLRVVGASLVVLLFVASDGTFWNGWRLREAGEWLQARRWNPADAWVRMAIAEAVDDPAAAREEAETAMRLAPNDGLLLRRAARLEASRWASAFPDDLNRRRVDRLYRNAEREAPYDPFIPMERAAFLLAAGDPASARRAAERVLDLEPQAARPWLLVARAFLQEGQRERAIEALEQARTRAVAGREEAQVSDYARDLLSFDEAIFKQLEQEATRQPDPPEPSLTEP